MKRLFIFFAVFALLLSGCKSGTEDSADVDSIPEMGGTINLQMRTPDTMDPLLTERQTTRDALMIIYEPLFNITDNFGIEGVLAESYSFSSDATTLTVKLKENVRWHNGERFTAEDVLYTVNKIKGNPQSSYYQNLSKLESVSKSGDSVVFKLTEPYHQFLYALYFPIENDGVDASSVCVGTGPYMMNEMTSRQMNLKRFEGWHGGSAYAENVTVFFMRTSAMAQEAFSSGKIHAVVSEMLDSENFALKEGMNETEYPNGVFDFVGFNTKSGLFSDPLLRIAASNAIDRTSLDEGVASGFPIMTGSEMFSPSYETTSFDSEYAGEVIFSAGWTDSDYDGVPEKTTDDGKRRLSFTLLVRSGDSSREKEAEKIAESLRATGFDVTIDKEEAEEYNSRISSGEYEAFLGEVYLYTPYDLSLLLSSDGSVNYFGYKSAEMDNALKTAASASDDSSFTASFSAIQSLFVAEQPITGIAFENDFIVTQPGVMGDIKPYPYSPYANIAKWYLKK